jgi:hypothetical protein
LKDTHGVLKPAALHIDHAQDEVCKEVIGFDFQDGLAKAARLIEAPGGKGSICFGDHSGGI